MSQEDEVRQASTHFYGALNRMLDGDNAPLADVWSHDATVTTFHPIGGRQTGWDEVRGSFEGVAGLASGGHAELRDQSVHVSGDLAYERAPNVARPPLPASTSRSTSASPTSIAAKRAAGRSSITTPTSRRRCWSCSPACSRPPEHSKVRAVSALTP